MAFPPFTLFFREVEYDRPSPSSFPFFGENFCLLLHIELYTVQLIHSLVPTFNRLRLLAVCRYVEGRPGRLVDVR